VSRDFELGRVSVQFANAFAIAITFARWWRHSEEATTVTYGQIFVCYFTVYMRNTDVVVAAVKGNSLRDPL